jgi:triosephosphate isomerase
MRTPIIAGNWKMNLGRVDEALALVRRVRYPLSQVKGVQCVLCPPFTVLAALAEILRPTPIALGAQTMHWEQSGAFTGEVSPQMLAPLCSYVILGHSERRMGLVTSPLADERTPASPDGAIHHKLQAALDYDLIPILCVGENDEQNEAGQTTQIVSGQVQAALRGRRADEAKKCVIAYEPIWAIGTGKAATPAGANSVIGLAIRGALGDLFGEDVAQGVRVLYGGSVNAGNVHDFMLMPEIDGALVGGASLKETFIDLVRGAAQAKGLS